jgi:hypothetical protein
MKFLTASRQDRQHVLDIPYHKDEGIDTGRRLQEHAHILERKSYTCLRSCVAHCQINSAVFWGYCIGHRIRTLAAPSELKKAYVVLLLSALNCFCLGQDRYHCLETTLLRKHKSLRNRVLISLIVYTFAQVGAAVAIRARTLRLALSLEYPTEFRMRKAVPAICRYNVCRIPCR